MMNEKFWMMDGKLWKDECRVNGRQWMRQSRMARNSEFRSYAKKEYLWQLSH